MGNHGKLIGIGLVVIVVIAAGGSIITSMEGRPKPP